MSDDYKSLKVPTWVYENAVGVQNDVLRKGIDSLPQEVLRPRHCPRCHHEVRFLEATAEVKFARMACPHCNYKQQTFSATGHLVAGVGLGVLLGLGIACLLETQKEPPRRRSVARKSSKRAKALPKRRGAR
jgi:hypothetical protein